MTCAECLRYAKCARTWKGTPRPECWIPGAVSWAKCAGCGMMRATAEAEKYPCSLCANRAGLTDAQWAVVKGQAEQHQAIVEGMAV